MNQVVLQHVHKSFGSTRGIRDVSQEINESEFVVFVGSSGYGKLTLLRLIAARPHFPVGKDNGWRSVVRSCGRAVVHNPDVFPVRRTLV